MSSGALRSGSPEIIFNIEYVKDKESLTSEFILFGGAKRRRKMGFAHAKYTVLLENRQKNNMRILNMLKIKDL